MVCRYLRGLISILLTCWACQEVSACGSYMEIKSPTTTSAMLSGPTNPDLSPCIWLIQAPSNYSVQLTITSLRPNVSISCMDYLEIRDGSVVSQQHAHECQMNTMITSTNRWLWIKFRHDSGTYEGFSASYSVVQSGLPDAKSPIVDCRMMSWRCPNKECISKAYRCDGYNDCGCTQEGCDEVGCGGMGQSANQQLIVGISVGMVISLLLFFGVGFLEIYLRKKHEDDNRRLLAEEEEKKKRRRRPTPRKDTGRKSGSSTPRSTPQAGMISGSSTPQPLTPVTLTAPQPVMVKIQLAEEATDA